MIPWWSSPIPTSSSARIIPWDSTPRSFALPSVEPSGITAPGRATATTWPAATLGAPHTIVLGVARADVDRADGQAVGIRVRFGGQDVADDEVGDVPDPNAVQPLDLQPGHRQGVGDLLGGRAGVAVLAQPCHRDPHAPNCSSSRASFS